MLQAASTARSRLSAPSSGSGRHISPLEPQAGAKAGPNLLQHLSFFSPSTCHLSGSLWIVVSPTKAYSYTCSGARLSEPRSSQRLGRHGGKKEAAFVSGVTSRRVRVTLGLLAVVCSDTFLCAYGCLFMMFHKGSKTLTNTKKQKSFIFTRICRYSVKRTLLALRGKKYYLLNLNNVHSPFLRACCKLVNS